MILYPAVDVLDGRAVRLVQGGFDDPTVYHDDPVEAAGAWLDAGARALHVVDLDGARAGEPVNLGAVGRIAALSGAPVQLGGGIRSRQHVSAALERGASRVVIGTAAYRDPSLVDEVVREHGARVAVAVDVRGGRVSAAGWTQDTGLDPLDAVSRLAAAGVRRFVYTNVDRDGMLTGPDLDEVARVSAAVEGALVWSGGVGGLDDLRALAAFPLEGVIVGKALYERRLDVPGALAVLDAGASTENVVRTMNAAFNAGAWEAWSALVDPGAVYEESPETDNYLDTPGRMEGRDAMRGALQRFGEPFDAWGAEIEELTCRDDRAVAATRWWGRGARSGLELDLREFIVWRLRGGRIAAGRAYAEREDALAALEAR